MAELWTMESLIAFLTLSGLEIVLGIDNIVFIVVVTGKLDPRVQTSARRIGIGLAMLTRIALLLSISWIMRLSSPFVTLLGHEVTGRDLVLLAGGLFLLAKATFEIHEKLETHEAARQSVKAKLSYLGAVTQIALLDLIFSLDSVITAVGMARHVPIMIAAIIVAVLVMLLFAGPVGNFVHKHPTIQMLAFAFLLLVGVLLVAEGMGKHIDRGYIYFAMAFSLAVEFLNLRMRRHGPAAAHAPTEPR